ncbi:MAG: hypothetical protein AAF571_01255 [Verrucomicrobiota bacterium]
MTLNFKNILQQHPRVSSAAAILLPACIYYAVLTSTHSINVPSSDDFTAILDWMLSWSAAEGFSEKASLLLQQHYSHRIVFTRITTLLSTAINGSVSFVFIQIVGWACWLAFAMLLVRNIPRLKDSLFWAFAAGLVLFNPIGFSNFITAMQGPQNLGIHFFALSAFILATSRNRIGIPLALTAGVAAIYISANGLVVLPIIAVYFAFHHRWKECAITTLIQIIAALIFFYGYERTSVTWDTGSLINQFFVMLGAPLCLLRIPYESAFWIGTPIALVTIIILSNFKLLKEHSVAWMFLAFLLGSCAMAALGRMGWPDDYMLQDRYRIYGILIILLTACLFPALQKIPKNVLNTMALFVALFYCLLGYLNNTAPLLSASLWKESTGINYQLGYPFPFVGEVPWPNAQQTLLLSDSNDIYQPPKILNLDTLSIIPETIGTKVNNPTWSAVRSNAGAGYWLISDTPSLPRPDAAYVVLPDREPVHLPQVLRRTSLKAFLISGKLISDEYQLMLPLHLKWTGDARIIETDFDAERSLVRSKSILPQP